jgi:CRP-like cAMP-binding protein
MQVRSSPVRNHILAHLPADTFNLLEPSLQRVELSRRQVLQEPDYPVRDVFFIEAGVANMLAHSARDGPIEVGIVGRFGFVGVPVVLGTTRSIHQCVMEVKGEALHVKANDLRRSMDADPILRRQLMSYVHALLIQNSQTVLCNALHHLEQRLARWLLLARDRLDDDVIPLTHELFSMMLGVRQAGTTAALAGLERAGAIEEQRAAVRIIDRELLENISCECYRIIAREYRRLLDPDGIDQPPRCDQGRGS